MSADKLYQNFHGRKPAQKYIAPFHIPKNLIFLGEAVSIVYKSNKKNGGGDGRIAEYEHPFTTPVGLFMDETGKKQLYLIGDKLKVTKAGIER